MNGAATIRPLPPADRYTGYCGICGADVCPLTHYDTELPLGSQHLCGACCGHVVTADVVLNHAQWANDYDAAPLTRPPRGCEADGDPHHR